MVFHGSSGLAVGTEKARNGRFPDYSNLVEVQDNSGMVADVKPSCCDRVTAE